MIDRKITKAVRVGGLMLGGGNPVLVQSMLNARADDIPANVAQAQRLEAAGCQLVRVTVPTPAQARVVTALKEAVSMPVVADIHFDYKYASTRGILAATSMCARWRTPAAKGASPFALA